MIRSRFKLPRVLTRIYRSKGGLWFPDVDEVLPRGNNCLALVGPAGGDLVCIPARNIVTTAGSTWYCQKTTAESPTNAFGIHEAQTGGTPGGTANRSNFTGHVTASQKAHYSGYPKRNDTGISADNAGGGATVVTFAVDYATGDFTQTAISHWIITNTSPGASEPILTGFAFGAPFDKTATDTLRIYINHTLSGS